MNDGKNSLIMNLISTATVERDLIYFISDSKATMTHAVAMVTITPDLLINCGDG